MRVRARQLAVALPVLLVATLGAGIAVQSAGFESTDLLTGQTPGDPANRPAQPAVLTPAPALDPAPVAPRPDARGAVANSPATAPTGVRPGSLPGRIVAPPLPAMSARTPSAPAPRTHRATPATPPRCVPTKAGAPCPASSAGADGPTRGQRIEPHTVSPGW